MILGNLKHILKFVDKEAAILINEFYENATVNTRNGEYPLKGDEIFAKVLSYETSATNNDMAEAHNKYVDVQVLLDGAETIKVYNRQTLKTRHEYNEETDCEFFYPEEEAQLSELIMKPGTVSVLFPQDVHLAALNFQQKEETVKKIVFKVYEKYFA